MKKTVIVLSMAVFLSAFMMLPCFGASDEIVIASSTYWVRDKIPMYNFSGFSAMEIVDGSIINPYYLVSPTWSYSSGHYNLSLDSNGYFSKDGYFSSGFRRCTFSQALSEDVSPYCRVIELDFAKALDVDGHMEFYIDTGNSSVDFMVSNLPSSYAPQWIDAIYLYYDSNGDLHYEFVTGTPVTASSNGKNKIFRFTFSNVHQRVVSIMIKFMFGATSLPTEMPSGTNPVIKGDFYFSDIVYESSHGVESSLPGGSVDLGPIDSQLDSINDGIHNNPYGELTLPPDQNNPDEIIKESQALEEFDGMLNDWDDFYSTFPVGLPAFWKTIIDTLFNLSIFAPFIICGVLFLVVRAVMGR